MRKKEREFRQLEILPKIKRTKNERRARIWAAVILVITIGISGLFWFVSSWPRTKPTWPKLPLLSSPKNTSLVKKSSRALSLLVNSRLKDEAGQWAVWVEELEGDFSWQLNGEARLPAASLIKLPVVAFVYQEVEAGRLSWEEEAVMGRKDLRSGAGSLQYQSLGTKVTYKKLAHLSLNQSDNTAFTILRRLLGDEEIDKAIDGMGMRQTSLSDNLTSAQDVGHFFKVLYQGKLINEQEEFLKSLTKTAYETRIPQGVPEGIKVAHKVGTEKRVVGDGGIVFVPQKPFVLVFLADGVNETKAEKVIVDLTRDIYWFLVSD